MRVLGIVLYGYRVPQKPIVGAVAASIRIYLFTACLAADTTSDAHYPKYSPDAMCFGTRVKNAPSLAVDASQTILRAFIPYSRAAEKMLGEYLLI